MSEEDEQKRRYHQTISSVGVEEEEQKNDYRINLQQ